MLGVQQSHITDTLPTRFDLAPRQAIRYYFIPHFSIIVGRYTYQDAQCDQQDGYGNASLAFGGGKSLDTSGAITAAIFCTILPILPKIASTVACPT